MLLQRPKAIWLNAYWVLRKPLAGGDFAMVDCDLTHSPFHIIDEAGTRQTPANFGCEEHRSDSVEGGMKPREPGAAIAVAVSEPAVCCEVPLGPMLGVLYRSVRVHPRARSVNIDWAPNFTAVRSVRVSLHRAMCSPTRTRF